MKLPANTDEKALLLRLRDGDGAAFEKIYHLYSGRIYGNILKLVKEKEAAQELLQDVFVLVWEKRLSIDVERSFSSYLFTISRNLVYNFMKRLAVEKKMYAHFSNFNSELYLHVAEDFDQKENADILKRAIHALPPQRRKIFTLCKIEGYSYDQVSQMLNISTSTINDHIVKATRTLKQQLGAVNPINAVVILSFLFSNLDQL